MALDKRLLDILCCPASKQPVALLSAAQLQALNRAVDAGQVQAADGASVRRSYSAGLLTRDGRTIYRIDDGIPVMLIDQAVSTVNVEGFPA
jgi:uncharacterized protein YbaR (Trm112 family)